MASGHVGGFNDPLMDCKACKARFRADKLIEDYTHGEETVRRLDATRRWSTIIAEHNIACPDCGKKDFTDIRQFNLMFKTFQGVTEDTASETVSAPRDGAGHLRQLPERACAPPARKLPFGIGQIGKSFRNEITPGNFIFRIREFEQMELEFFCKPGTDLEWFDYWRTFCTQLAAEPGHEGGKPAPARPRAGRAGLLFQGHHGL